ncbi:MAG: chloride channel protein [Flavobacteriales bacterium]
MYSLIFGWAEDVTSSILHGQRWLLFVVTPVCFVFAWWLVNKYSPYSRGSGIPQVMASIELANPKENHLIKGFLSLKVIVVKIASSALMVMGGGVIGREGPTIQIASSVFESINNMLPSWWPKISRKNVIVAGAASGLAAAFNTPLGGIVFAVEELAKTHISYFRTALFTAVIIAGLTAQGLAGPYLYLGYPNLQNLTAFVFVGIILVGVIAGMGGAYMGRAILQMLAFMKSVKKGNRVFYVISFALIVASFGYFLGEDAIGSGKEVMTSTLFSDDKNVEWYTPIVRGFGQLFSFSTGASGGIFAPSLSVGASVGSVMAQWLELSASNTNMLILAGMVAFLTGVTRSPFTSAILVLEMTDRHNVIFHLMLAGMLAGAAATLIDRKSIYDRLKDQYLDQVRKG